MRWTHLSAGEGAGPETWPGNTASAAQDGIGRRHPLSQPRATALELPRQDATTGFSFELDEAEGRQQGQDARHETRRESGKSIASAGHAGLLGVDGEHQAQRDAPQARVRLARCGEQG